MLRIATERLAAELVRPAAEAPDWSPVAWRMAMAAAVIHGITGLLADRLRWEGPAIWQAFLADQRHQMRLREQRIRAVLRDIDAQALREGVPLVGLKGATLLGMSLYAPGTRPMADIDLLVRPRDRAATLRLLGALGYQPDVDAGRHLTLLPVSEAAPTRLHFGEHADQPVKIELHTRVAERLPLHAVDITASLLPRTTAAGLNAYPDLAALMRHLVLHAAGNMRMHSVRLIQLHDLALMADRLTESDWSMLARHGGEPAWWALPPLCMARRQFPFCTIDEHRLRALGTACSPWLRRHAERVTLGDVSSSGALIHLLPGLVWSRGVSDVLGLMRERLWISGDKRRLQQAVVATQPWLRSTGSPRTPRAWRAARWLAGARTAPAARFCVDQALAYQAP